MTEEKHEIERLRSVLAYYADPSNWNSGDVPGHIYAVDDAGGYARSALGLKQMFEPEEEWEISQNCREIANVR